MRKGKKSIVHHPVLHCHNPLQLLTNRVKNRVRLSVLCPNSYLWNWARPCGAPGLGSLSVSSILCKEQTPASMSFPEFQRTDSNSFNLGKRGCRDKGGTAKSQQFSLGGGAGSASGNTHNNMFMLFIEIKTATDERCMHGWLHVFPRPKKKKNCMYTGSSSTTSKFWASLSPEMRCMISTKDCVFKSQNELYNLATTCLSPPLPMLSLSILYPNYLSETGGKGSG